MEIKIALAGNPNCGKTTLFNALTGSRQYVGNWPGVTVEKKDGRLKGYEAVIIQDLPGIYSLSPYTLEETVTRRYLVEERPDAILNIIDGTNIERNLYLTTQLIEIGLPVVIAINMMDLVRKRGDTINVKKLGAALGCEVVEISALQGEGCRAAAKLALELGAAHRSAELPPVFAGSVEHCLAHLEETLEKLAEPSLVRWYAIKAFERDREALAGLPLQPEQWAHLEQHIKDCEQAMNDDAESIITNQRYSFISKVVASAVVKKAPEYSLTMSDRIDQVVTNRFLALPIFAAVMTLMYYLAVTTVGGYLTDWVNEILFGKIITGAAEAGLEVLAAPKWLSSLILDGIMGGVGTVLGFVPQIVLIFFFLSLLEDSGYMARVAFIMDRIFRKFGLSGKSFIPLLIGTGCGVPAIMAARTIENEADRRLTIMLSTFIPCTAKSVIIGMITATFFPDSIFIAPAMYFLGIGVIVLSGMAWKKTAYFSGAAAPFVMELPAYHLPSWQGLWLHVWERSKGFIIKAGTLIFTASVAIWFLAKFNFSLVMVEEIDQSILAVLGHKLAFIFAPLGLGDWKSTVAVISAEMAKEQAVGTLAVLNGVADPGNNALVTAGIKGMFTPLAALAFLVLNLFDPPCVVAMVAIVREMNNKFWAALALGYQLFIGYTLAFIVYQLGSYFVYGVAFGASQGVACLLLAAAAFLVVRPDKKPQPVVAASQL